jgi:hypothetical protein
MINRKLIIDLKEQAGFQPQDSLIFQPELLTKNQIVITIFNLRNGFPIID